MSRRLRGMLAASIFGISDNGLDQRYSLDRE